MKICTQTATFQHRFGVDNAIREIAKAGFDSYDISLCYLPEDHALFNPSTQLDEIERLKEISKECGITCHQAHAPMPSSSSNPDSGDYDTKVFGRIVNSLEIAAMLGAKQIVIHPKQHLPYFSNKKALAEINYEFYQSLLPYAKQYGIRIAVENMFKRDGNRGGVIIDSVCSDPKEFCEYLDALDPKWFVACLDVGHTAIVGRSVPEMIRALGHNRLHALHLQDNDLVDDRHTMPLLQKLPWDEIIKALADIEYDGYMTLEADAVFKKAMPDDIARDILRLMAKVDRYLADSVQALIDEKHK